MTDFDKKLIDKARQISRYHYRDIDVLSSIADTNEAKDQLTDIRWELYDLAVETM